MVFAAQNGCLQLADWIELDVLAELPHGARIMKDGATTLDIDGGTFYRDDLTLNYSVDCDWLLEFVVFLRACGGFETLG